jgi:hypothetical protein
MTLSISEEISRKCGGRAIFHLFNQTAWSDRSEALVKVGLVRAPSCSLSEVSAEDAQSLLALSLSKDLCYGTRRMGSDTGSDLAASFLALFTTAARYYTNSQTPYHLKGAAWAFSSLTSGIVDTGVIVRSGKFLSGVLWLSDLD